MLSNGFWGFGRRWMYPWVECLLVVSPVSAVREEKHAVGVEEFDGLMNLRVEGRRMILHREFSDIAIDLIDESRVDLHDTGSAVNAIEGMVVISRTPLDLSYIKELLARQDRADSA
jgi:hypothetical protein